MDRGHNKANHGDAYCIAASPSFRSRACWLALTARHLWVFGWSGAKALASRLAAKPAHSGDRQGRKIRCLVWLPQWSAVLVFMVCPSRGAVRLKR